MEYDAALYPVIHLTGHQKHIYPWIQEDLHTPFWRCYWNAGRGGCLRVEEREIELRPIRFISFPDISGFPRLRKSRLNSFISISVRRTIIFRRIAGF